MKKIFLATIMAFSLLAGCGKVITTNTVNTVQQNGQPSSAAAITSGADTKSPGTTTSAATITTNDAIDYNQYIKKTWVMEKGTNNFSFCISKIANGEITGRFTLNVPAVPNQYDVGHLTGTIDKDTAECQFSDKVGNKGSLKLVFKENNQIEASIKYTDKLEVNKDVSSDGDFLFKPYNLKDIAGFSPLANQSFAVDLNYWGNVNFVSGKLTAGNHIPVVFYLTNEDGDILYDFNATLPYSVDINAVSFKDVNKDGLKDVIIIAADNYADSGKQIAAVYLQKVDGAFTNDPKLDQEINNSGNNKDIKTITDYLSQKF